MKLKQLLLTFIVLMATITSYSQCNNSPEYRFRKPTLNSGVYTFSNVLSGLDAEVTITATKNAQLSAIDDSSRYAYAWCPFIRFTQTNQNTTDSSWVEFEIAFKRNSSPDTQSCLRMTIVDLDGTTNYRELIKSTYPVSAQGFYTTNITWGTEPNWYTFISDSVTFNTIDTLNYEAMAMLIYPNVQKYRLRIGIIGQVQANQVRQYCLYYKKYDSLTNPLPVHWLSIDGKIIDNQYQLNWIVDESNVKQYQVEKQIGEHWTTIYVLNSIGHGINEYQANMPIENDEIAVFRIKRIDYDGDYSYSNKVAIRQSISEDDVMIFYNSYGIQVYEGYYSDFLKIAEYNTFYFTSTGHKFAKQ